MGEKNAQRNPGQRSPDLGAQMERLGLTTDDLVEMYSAMCKIRQFEVMADRLYAQGKVHGTMHLSAGQEAVAVGTWRAVRRDAYFLNHHRGHGHFIARGSDVNLMMAEFLGKDSGYCRGRGGSMHIADIETNNLGANGIVGGGISLGVGVGLALKLQEKENLVVDIFGDGAANEGIFHESLNMAALWELPILFICENNHYGMSMEVSRATAKLPIAQRAEGYGIPWKYIDGNDLMLVYETIQQAVAHIQSGKGPYFVEAETYRYFGHSKSDRNLYRTREEIDEWKRRDPILRLRQQMVDAGIMTEQAAEEIDQKALQLIEAAVAFAEAAPEPDPSTLLEYVYA
jgi:pyruvate dehydrogenase E1 component alpha subunit